MANLPLLQHHALTNTLAFRNGKAISVAQFLYDAERLANRLPQQCYMINLCNDRYHFLVGFAAALLRRQISLLPSSQAPQVLKILVAKYNKTYFLSDNNTETFGIETLYYRDEPGKIPPTMSIPLIPKEQVATVLFTSGSTGRVTPHTKTWGMLMAGATLTGQRLSLGNGESGSFITTVPPQHMFGLETSITLPLRWGQALDACQPFYPLDIKTALEAIPAPRILVTTPLHLRACIAAKMKPPVTSFILSSTAPLPQNLAQTTEQLFNCPVMEIYGCTEAGAIATRRTVNGKKWQALPGMQLQQQQQACFLMAEHLPEPIPLSDKIHCHTPEAFTLLGRNEDLIKIGGKRESLIKLNHTLLDIPGIQDGVFFMPEESIDQVTRLTAFVVAPGLNQQTILEALRDHIDAAFLPRPLYMVDCLPRNDTGKLPRQRLFDLYTSCNNNHRKQVGAG